MSEREYASLKNALASTRMEGFDVTEQTVQDCVRLMDGDISVAELVKEIFEPSGNGCVIGMGYSLEPTSDNCYPGTTVLINKFNIQDEAKLNEVETVLVSARSAELMEHPKADSFDFAHYKTIHQFLFSDLYDWAGQIRTVDLSKKGTRFCPAESIEHQADLIFRHPAAYRAKSFWTKS